MKQFFLSTTGKVKSLKVSDPLQMIFDDNRMILGFDTGSYYTETQVDTAISSKADFTYIYTQLTNRPTYNDLSVYVQK